MGVSTPRRPPVPYRPPQTDRLEPTLSPAAVLPSGSTRGPCRAPHCRLRPLTAARASTPRRPPALTPRTICPSPYQGEARWGSPLRDSPRPHTGHLKTDRFRPISPPPRRCPWTRPEGLPPRGTCQYWAPHRPSKLAPRSIEGCGRNPPPPQKKQKSRRIAATAPALESAHSLEA